MTTSVAHDTEVSRCACPVESWVRASVLTVGWSLLAFGGGTSVSAAGPTVATLAVGDFHSCAVRTNGTVWCWGYANRGQIGDGTLGEGMGHVRSTPARVLRGSSYLKDVTKVAAGGGSSCAVRNDGSAWCWGDATYGQLGNGESGDGAQRTKAVRVRRGSGYLTGVRQLSAGDHHACALRADGAVLCWGDDQSGQLGDGTTGRASDHVRTSAVRVRQGSGYLRDVVAIAAASQHTCAIKGDGSAWCWGEGYYGQLGDGQSGPGHYRTKAVRVKRGGGYLTRASGIAADGLHTCARRTDGTAWCWGYAAQGQLGDGTTGSAIDQTRSKPVQVARGSGVLGGVTGLGAGGSHTCARRSDGSAFCWGAAAYGQLGDGTTGDSTTHQRLRAVRVVRSTGSFTGVRKLDGGALHTCAARTDGTVWCWGLNTYGNLGVGTTDDDPHPFPRKVTFP